VGKCLKEPVPAIGQLVELHHGLWHAGGGIAQTVTEWKSEDVRLYVLDADAPQGTTLEPDASNGTGSSKQVKGHI
jgi:hypothetical protein